MGKDFKLLKAAELCKQLRFIMSYPQKRYDYQNEFTFSFEKVLFTHDFLPVIYKTVCQVTFIYIALLTIQIVSKGRSNIKIGKKCVNNVK